ncbi:NDR1/HIN1-like protein 1 [Linum grandiflorum]
MTSVTIPAAAVPTNNHTETEPFSLRLVLSIGIAFFVLVLVYAFASMIIQSSLKGHPPTFEIADATFYAFNLTNSTNGRLLLTTSLEANFASRNPNRYLSIDYVSSMETYASYHGQRITLPAELPRAYLGSKEAVEWSSPVLSGENVPLSPEMAAAVGQDLSYGIFPLELKVYGKLRFNVGPLFKWKNSMDFDCSVAYVMTSGGNGGGGGKPPSSPCLFPSGDC